jgi:hypothetical protein
MFLAGAAPQVLGTLGSLQQAITGAQQGATASNGSFDFSALGPNSRMANSKLSGTATSISGTALLRSSPGTMATLLVAQGTGNTDDNGVTAFTTAPANAHRRASFYSPPGGNLSISA